MPPITHRQPAAAAVAALLGLVALWPASAARAQVASAPRIGVVDTEKILITSATGKAALAQLKALQEQKEKELGGRQQEIKDLQGQISDGRLSLAADKLATLQKQLEEKVIVLRRAQDDATREMTAKRDEMLAAIDQKVMPVINRFGKEQGYTLIFRKFESGLIYADEAIDITDEMIRRVDAAR